MSASNLHNRRHAHHKENIVQHVLAQLDADVACSDVRLHQHHRVVKAAVAVVNAEKQAASRQHGGEQDGGHVVGSDSARIPRDLLQQV